MVIGRYLFVSSEVPSASILTASSASRRMNIHSSDRPRKKSSTLNMTNDTCTSFHLCNYKSLQEYEKKQRAE